MKLIALIIPILFAPPPKILPAVFHSAHTCRTSYIPQAAGRNEIPFHIWESHITSYTLWTPSL